jgi:hypothetical protein
MYKYPLTTSQQALSLLDDSAGFDGYEDANTDYPHTMLSDDLKARANGYVNTALEVVEDLTDNPEEYRARYVDAYCTAYARQIAARREDEEQA